MSNNNNIKKYLKILCCDHFLNYLHRNFIEYLEVSDKFYECQHRTDEHKFVAVKCVLCRFNFLHNF